jgi:HlyD family secretion protein
LEIAPGDHVGAYEPFGAIADPAELWAVAVVPEDQARLVGVGQQATVRLDVYPDQTYAGSVLQIGSTPVAWQGGAAYEVVVALDMTQDVPAAVQVGADVTILGRQREGVLVVPNRALITIAGTTYVEIVGPSGEAERIEVRVGISSDTETEIVSGLEQGQEIRIP